MAKKRSKSQEARSTRDQKAFEERVAKSQKPLPPKDLEAQLQILRRELGAR